MNTLQAVCLSTATEGYAVGENGTIAKTTNGGITWTLLPGGTTNGLNPVSFPSPTTGYIVGGYGIILKTVNGGLSWTRLSCSNSYSLYSVCFTVYANPETDRVTVAGNSRVHGIIHVGILDMHGRPVLQAGFSGQEKLEPDIRHVPGGVYLVKIQSEDRVETKKLVKR